MALSPANKGKKAGPQVETTHAPDLYLKVAGGDEIGYNFLGFEWMAFVNGGFVIRATIADPDWNILRKLATEFYLKKARKEPTRVEFKLGWKGGEDTGIHLGYLTDLHGRGQFNDGKIEFVAVDPPSWWLNAGDCSGDVYKGSVQEVIKQVIKKYYEGPNGFGKGEVSKTLDNKNNQWWQMRMDPKTFIASLVDWASSVTEKKTNFIISSDGSLDSKGDPKAEIVVKEQAEKETKFIGTYRFNVRDALGEDVKWFNLLADTYISVFQKQLITCGISSVSERFFDRKTDQKREVVHVHDENTPEKKNSLGKDDQDFGFAKPKQHPRSVERPHDWSTSITAIPQHNAGDIGMSYDKYIDGRARTQFLDMLKHVMRIKITVQGEPNKDLAITHNLGVSKIAIDWKMALPETGDYFLAKDWMIYGFHHRATRDYWDTDLYCYRLDYDAEAKKI
jgi:hypothetical protein